MGRKLVITHGERTTQHEIIDRALVIGRDPGCDIFFIDQKLSRRHSRIEPRPDGVHLIDLGSRNGTWVNEVQVEQQLLKPGDEVRVGGLRILYDEDVPAAFQVESTVIMDPELAADERTLMLGAPPPSSSPETTLMLPNAASMPAGDAEPGTVAFKTGVFQPRDEPEFKTQVYSPGATDSVAETRIAPLDLAETAKTPVPTVAPAERSQSTATVREHKEAVVRRLRQLPVEWRVGAVIFAVGLLGYIVASVPPPSWRIEEESMERGRTLLRFLAAVNVPALSDRRFQDLTTDGVKAESGVKDALILDPNGRVLAPAARSNEAVDTIEEFGKKLADIQAVTTGRTKTGDFKLVQPLFDKGRRMGFAMLTYSPTRVTTGGASFFLGILVITAGTYGAFRLAKKTLLSPVAELREAVDAVIRGDAPFVDPTHPYPELAELAESINRLADAPSASPATKAPWSSPLALVETASYDPVARPPLAPKPVATAPVATTPPPLPKTPSSPNPSRDSTRDEPRAPGAELGESELVLDENFVVTRIHPTALAVLDSSPGEVEGKHLIEAIREQKLLELMLDLVNGLAAAPKSSGSCELEESGLVSVVAERRGQEIVVTLTKR